MELISKILNTRIAIILVVVSVLPGCSDLLSLYLAHFFYNRGYIEQHDYKETLKFDEKLGVIIIPVVVNGVKGRFLLDTGAANVITPDFAKRVSAETGGLFTFNVDTKDSGGNQLDGYFITIDNVHIGNLSYREINFVVIPLIPGGSVVSDCLSLDGIIGANLMKKSIWKIDYVNKDIVITDSLDNLGDLTGFDSIPFRTIPQGTPLFDLNIDGVTVKDIYFDTGKNGYLSIPKTYQGQFPENPANEFYVDGSVSYGAGGKSQQTRTEFQVFNMVQIGTLSFDNLAVGFSEYFAPLGNGILKHYDVILDWTSSEILMKEVNKFQDKRNFDFVTDVRTDGIFVTGIYSNSPVQLLAGDQIVSWNGKDMRDMTENQKCLLFSGSWRGDTSGDVNLRVIRDSEEIPVTWVRD